MSTWRRFSLLLIAGSLIWHLSCDHLLAGVASSLPETPEEGAAAPWQRDLELVEKYLSRLDTLDPALAKKHLESALAIAYASDADMRVITDILDRLGDLSQDWKDKNRKATAIIEESIRLKEEHFGPEDPSIAKSLQVLSDISWAAGRYCEAIQLLCRGLELQEKGLGTYHPDVARSLELLGSAYGVLEDFDTAARFYERRLEVNTRVFGEEHRETTFSLSALAEAYRKLGRHEEADELERRVDENWRREPPQER